MIVWEPPKLDKKAGLVTHFHRRKRKRCCLFNLDLRTRRRHSSRSFLTQISKASPAVVHKSLLFVVTFEDGNQRGGGLIRLALELSHAGSFNGMRRLSPQTGHPSRWSPFTRRPRHVLQMVRNSLQDASAGRKHWTPWMTSPGLSLVAAWGWR
eukprot:scaffold434_cov186-Pinguiococcus_pyrenoidosus.AAC.119